MVPVRAYAGQRVCVLRLTKAGLGAAQALRAGGAKVTVWDEDPARRRQADDLEFTVEDPSTRDWSGLSLLVVGDASMLDASVSIRAVEVARALEIPVIDGLSLVARGLSDGYETTLCAIVGTRATALAKLVRRLLESVGVNVVGPDLTEKPGDAGPGTIALLPVEAGQLPVLPDVLAVWDTPSLDPLTAHIDAITGPVVLNADDAAAARLATRVPSRSILASGCQSLGGGVFVCAGSVFEGLDGSPRRLTGAPASDGVRFTPPELLAMAHGIVRAVGISSDRARDALNQFEGLEGWGALVSRFGSIAVLDYSQAKDLRAALLALRAPGPVIWVGGSALETGAAALIEAAGRTPTAIYLAADRRKAAKSLARLCPTRIVADTDLLSARALFAALKAGPEARIVLAPGCEEAIEPVTIVDALERLIAAVRESEAA